jgi:hypothetical protein
MADYKQKQFFGTAQTVINTATDIASGNFSGAPAAAFDNTSDGSVPSAPKALAMIELPDWGAAPAAGDVIELWGVLLDTDGTDDDTDAPSGSSEGGARYFGVWPVAAADALQRRTIVISLDGVVNDVNFYIKNATTQNLNNDGGTNCVVKITPFADGVTV